MSSTQPLIGKQYLQNQVIDQIQLIKKSNGQLQQLISGDQDENDISEIKLLKSQMPKDIQKLKELMGQLERSTKNSVVRQRMKQINNEASKEIDKFGQLMRLLINTSFNFQLSLVDKEEINGFDQEELKQLQESFSKPRVINFEAQNNNQVQNLRSSPVQNNQNQDQTNQQKNEGNFLQQQQSAGKTLNFETVKVENPPEEEEGQVLRTIIHRKHRTDAEFEASMLNEKQRQIDKLEKDMLKMNDIMKDIDFMVQDGQEDLNLIIKNIKVGEKEVIEANEEMEEAAKTQKGNTKCYIIIVIVVCICIITLLLILFLTGSL